MDNKQDNNQYVNLPPNEEELQQAKEKKSQLMRICVTAGILFVASVLLACFLRGGIFAGNGAIAVLGILLDAFLIPGFVALGIGGLIWCSSQGAFDSLSYGARAFGSMFTKAGPSSRKFSNMREYQDYRSQRRDHFGHWFVIGGAFCLAGVICWIIKSLL